MEEPDEVLKAFTVGPLGFCYECECMSFGLPMPLSSFRDKWNHVLGIFLWVEYIIYLDYIIVLQLDTWRAFRKIGCSISESSRGMSKTEAIRMWVVQKRDQISWVCGFQIWNFNWCRQDKSSEGMARANNLHRCQKSCRCCCYYMRFIKDFSKYKQTIEQTSRELRWNEVKSSNE